ncbi:MAG: YbjN domain-containing protein [Streptosporangiales bacterium]|nr:YbjN domain-containing protein [Streptosporangiales bacterium]
MTPGTGRPKPPPPAMPDNDSVVRVMEILELKHVVDEDGDVCAPFEDFRVYYMFRGEDDQRTFAVRTFYDTDFPLAAKPAMLDVADEWNRRALWPKAYTHTTDAGVLRMVSETQMPIIPGMSDEHFNTCAVAWTQAAVDFSDWMVQEMRTRTQ